MEIAASIAPENRTSSEGPPLWEVRGPVRPAKISPLYQIGMLAVAVAMVLLPLLYIALIAGVGYATARYAVIWLALFETAGNEKGKVFAVAPLVVGVLVVLFMIKPLFARRPKRSEPREISREDEPALFAFIDRICDLVHAPRPRRVLVDLQVNASASFRRGFLSLFGQDLTLTIGLPLVAGLNVRQFGGVLAHEFGHFAQGVGMRLTFIIRSVNAWFYRVVYERDAWDEHLASTARSIDLRIGVILHLSRLMIWLTRKLLWVFMIVGHGISCFMLRQMEFDADHYETQLSGSGGFAETAERLRLLSLGWQRAIAQQQQAFQGKRLVDDLPGLIAIETQRLPGEACEALQKAAHESKTGWFDTHPSDADRVRAAEAEGTSGVLSGEAPARELFADFSTRAQGVTEAYYREECELDLRGVRFLPLTEMAAEASTQAEADRSLKEFFGELLSIRSLVFLDSAAPNGEFATPTREEIDAVRSHQRALLEKVPPTMKSLLDADHAQVLACQGRALLDAGFKIKKDEFQLTAATPEAAETAASTARAEVQQHRAELDAAISATRDRLTSALRSLGNPHAPDASPTARESAQLLTVLSRLDAAHPVLVALRNDQAAFELLLHNASNAGDKWSAAAQSLAAGIKRSVAHILSAVQGVNYPFAHAHGAVTLADFLGECAAHENELVQTYLRGQAVLDRFLSTCSRTLARLAALAKQGEAQCGAKPADTAVVAA